MKKSLLTTLVLSTLISPVAFASDDSEIVDMSDPLAVFTQLGAGYTSKGLNFKVGQTYDTENDLTSGMNVIELKGLGGDSLGWDDSTNDSFDSIRFRNFAVDLTDGSGKQLDVSYDFNTEQGSASYSYIKTLPSIGNLNLYPLAGVGAAFGNDIDEDGNKNSGYTFPGTFGLIGAYTKYAFTDKLWLNYNPMWTTTLSGSDNYQDYGMGGDSHLLSHELALSYQFTPRFNVRYFANWDEHTDFNDGDHRIEFNYQI